MSLSVVLTTSPVKVSERYGVFAGAASTQPSFGLVSVAAAGRETGAQLRVIDSAAENLSVDAAFRAIMRLDPDVVGISSTTCGIVAAGELAASIKKTLPQVVVALGGPHVTAIPEETLREFPAIDVAVVGEGEVTFSELLRGLHAKREVPEDLHGIGLRRNGVVQVNQRRPLISDMDELPLPAWSLLRSFPKAFRPSPGRVKRYPCASVVLMRGCPNTCLFCDRSVFGNRCRAYSPARAVTILRDLVKNYGVKEILIEDDTFFVFKHWIEEFCQRLIAEKLDITWSCLGRVDRITPALLKLLRRSGCWHISFGIESGDPNILSAMNKRVTLEQIEQAVRWSKDAGLVTKGFFIVGFPDETRESLDATRKLATSLSLDDISVMQMTPFPGTALFAVAEQMGRFDRDWTKMSTLETVFVPNGFTKEALEKARARILREFYFRPRIFVQKGLHALLHPRVGWHMLKAFASLVRVAGTNRS